jgi:hypothetical protein
VNNRYKSLKPRHFSFLFLSFLVYLFVFYSSLGPIVSTFMVGIRRSGPQLIVHNGSPIWPSYRSMCRMHWPVFLGNRLQGHNRRWEDPLSTLMLALLTVEPRWFSWVASHLTTTWRMKQPWPTLTTVGSDDGTHLLFPMPITWIDKALLLPWWEKARPM